MVDIALVTGGSKGIGRAIALELGQEGFDIWLNYRSDHKGAGQTAAQLREMGRACRLLPFDVSIPEDAEKHLVPLLREETPYILVNNAGFTKDAVMGLMSRSGWEDVLSVHLGGFFNVTHLVVPHMQRARRGRIVNIASVSGQTGTPGQVNYSAAKAGLIGATKALARELGRRNILVNAVAPGLIETHMTSTLPMDAYLKSIPLGRAGTAREVASCVRFLCTEAASYITGEVISVNGGLYM